MSNWGHYRFTVTLMNEPAQGKAYHACTRLNTKMLSNGAIGGHLPLWNLGYHKVYFLLKTQDITISASN